MQTSLKDFDIIYLRNQRPDLKSVKHTISELNKTAIIDTKTR